MKRQERDRQRTERADADHADRLARLWGRLLQAAQDELDLVVETAGAPTAVELATELCRPGGRAVLLGIAGEGRTLTLPSDLFVSKDMALIGSIAYPAATWSRVVGLVADRVLDLDPIVTHRFPVSDFEEAVALMDDRRGIVAKIVLEH